MLRWDYGVREGGGRERERKDEKVKVVLKEGKSLRKGNLTSLIIEKVESPK